jgi:hypothetical protein
MVSTQIVEGQVFDTGEGEVTYPVTRLLPFSPLRRCGALVILVGTVLGLAATASALACAASGKVTGPTKEPAGQSAPDVHSAQPSFQLVQEITLERLCFRCPDQYRLTFHSNGTATRATFAEAIQTFRGTVTREEFDALAKLLQREGFFDLAEVYHDPKLRDGSAVTTSVVLDRVTKSVINSNQTGPPQLKAIEDAIFPRCSARTQVTWTS